METLQPMVKKGGLAHLETTHSLEMEEQTVEAEAVVLPLITLALAEAEETGPMEIAAVLALVILETEELVF
jgi:hypothetical protein